MNTITVACAEEYTGWRCGVTVADERSSRYFEVIVSKAELARFAPGDDEPTDLVHRSFEFLLQREAKESILRSFPLSTISRYFPEYEREITQA